MSIDAFLRSPLDRRKISQILTITSRSRWKVWVIERTGLVLAQDFEKKVTKGTVRCVGKSVGKNLAKEFMDWRLSQEIVKTLWKSQCSSLLETSLDQTGSCVNPFWKIWLTFNINFEWWLSHLPCCWPWLHWITSIFIENFSNFLQLLLVSSSLIVI